MKRAVIAVLCFAVAACFAGCDQQESGKVKIAVIPMGTTHDFWKSIHAGAKKAAGELGVEIIWKGPLNEGDRNAQIDIVDSFVTRRVSGIVMAPVDSHALVEPVKRAVKAGIPVVIVDSELLGEDHLSFIATDNYKGGSLAGEHMAKLLGGKGNVVMLRYAAGSVSTTKREQGFLDAVTKHGGIKVLSENQRGGTTSSTAADASENLLESLKGEQVDGIFCPNESTTFGMLRTLQNRDRAGKVKFVGFDSSPKLVQGLKDGHIQGLILQDPAGIGYRGVKTLVAHLNGKKVEPKVDMVPTLVTKENMDQPEIKALLEPPAE